MKLSSISSAKAETYDILINKAPRRKRDSKVILLNLHLECSESFNKSGSTYHLERSGGSRDLEQPTASSEAKNQRNLGQPIISSEVRG